ITAAQHGLVLTIQRVSKPDTRGNLFAISRYASGRGIIRVHHRGLRQVRIIVPNPQIEGQPRGEFPLVLCEEAVVFDRVIDGWIPDVLREGQPVLGSRGVPAEIESQVREVGVGVGSGPVLQVTYIILGWLEYKSEFPGV